MRVGIVGSRNPGNLTVEKIMDYVPDECNEVISGGAQGVDKLAEEFARLHGFKLRVLRPHYHLAGKRAPLLRNELIVNMSDFVVVFWDMKSKGTMYTLNYCIITKTPYRLVDLRDLK